MQNDITLIVTIDKLSEEDHAYFMCSFCNLSETIFGKFKSNLVRSLLNPYWFRWLSIVI